MYSEVYKEINEKIEILKRLDKHYGVFGSETYKYTFNEKLTEEEVASFEKLNNIELPEGYRGFLINVGNGGAGLAYEVFGIDINKKDEDLAQEFILDESYHSDCDFTARNVEDKERYLDCEKCIHSEKCLNSTFWGGKEHEEERYLAGTKNILFEGCSYNRRLVLNGKYKGWMWSASEGQGLLKSDMDFLKNYVFWLDNNIKKVSRIKELVEQRKSYKEIDEDEELKMFTMKSTVIGGFMREEIEGVTRTDITKMTGSHIIKVYEYIREKEIERLDLIKRNEINKEELVRQRNVNKKIKVFYLIFVIIVAVWVMNLLT
ncbi:hypothetical protein [uncultured Clostridium sp.]|jgi:hypothetical protein|uniref:hypothetical protein n=1 Tax=uncultured Clostridium sp. TaxID=59620 RepID=UPI0026158B6B|nr:hypothetical protein [uncultured Clostridium sp.]